MPQLSRTSSLRSNGRGTTPSSISSELSDNEPSPVSKHPRRGSSGSKPPSRPTSRLSRIRANSSASGEEEKSGNEKSRRMSITGWASSAVDSVTGSKGKKSKDTEAFATLEDDATTDDSIEYQSKGTGNTTPKKITLGRSSSNGKSKESLSLKAAPRILKPPSMQGRKVVRALYDFSGSTDELSFNSGNEIVVLNEVLDDWWMGELDGQKGLFPLSYTEAISSRSAQSGAGVSQGVDGYRKHDDYLTSDVDSEGELATAPMAIGTPIYGTFNDAMSFTSSLGDEEDDFRTQPMFFPQEVQPSFAIDHRFVTSATPLSSLPPPVPQRPKRMLSEDSAQELLINGEQREMATPTLTKKQPPPPPPRRPANRIFTSGPPVPERKAPLMKTSPSESLLNVTSSPIGSVNRSPFESAVELVACVQFRQNPFKPKGMCSNCLEFHD